MLASRITSFNIRVCQLNPSEVTTAFNNQERIERDSIENKLSPEEIAHSICSVLEMEDKGFITELSVEQRIRFNIIRFIIFLFIKKSIKCCF